MDIEGTTTPIAFVRDVLFPYARARLPAFIDEHGEDRDVAALLAEASRLAGGGEPLPVLLAWMDQDAKVTPLKAIQGLIWNQGYLDGDLRGRLYPDVPPVLHAMRDAGLRLYIYSSGSIASQRLLFAHSTAGDLTPLIDGYFDTTIGQKRDPASYRAIARATGSSAAEILFLSDTAQELQAAREACLETCQLVRLEDATRPEDGFARALDFTELSWR